MKEIKKIDKAVKEKLEGFSVTPPPHIWENVQGQLAAENRNKRMAFTRWIAAAAVVLLAMLAGWYFNHSTQSNSQITAQQQTPGINTVVTTKTRSKEKEIQPKELIGENTTQTQSNKKGENSGNSQKQIPVLPTPNTVAKNSLYKEDLPPAREKQLKFAKINRKEIRFNALNTEISLAKQAAEPNEFALTNTDKMLIAANVASKKTDKFENRRWKMGLNVSPGYSSQIVNHSESYAQNMSYSGETGNTNIGGGFALQYKTGKRFSIESGVYYAQNGQKSATSTNLFAANNDVGSNYYSSNKDFAMDAVGRVSAPTFSNAVNINNGTILMNGNAGIVALDATPKGAEITTNAETKSMIAPGTMVTEGEFSQVFNFIEIPLLLRFRILDTKFGIDLVGGINTGIVVGNNAYIDNNYGVQNVGSTQNISEVNLSGAAGIGMNYALGKHISVAIEPRLNYYFNSINNNPEVDFRPYRIGIYTGVYYAF